MIHEVYVFINAMGCGAIAGFVYDLIRLKRRAVKTRALVVGLEDVIFWIFTALLVFTTSYFSNQGELRLYFFTASVIGVVIYFGLLSRWVTQILTFLIKIFIYPFSLLFHILEPPARWISELVGKGARKTKKRMDLTRVRIRRHFKSIHHIIRKL